MEPRQTQQEHFFPCVLPFLMLTLNSRTRNNEGSCDSCCEFRKVVMLGKKLEQNDHEVNLKQNKTLIKNSDL